MKVSELIPARLLLSSLNADISIQGVSDHTEDVHPGDLFICRRGARFDPSYLLPLVEKKGAAAVVAEEGLPLPPLTIPCFRVKDIKEAEAEIWCRFYGMPQSGITLIGITGTNGKTSTAKILCHILTNSGRVCGYIGTLGVELNGRPVPSLTSEGITTPSAALLFRTLRYFRDNGVTTVVMEVSSHALVQKRVHGLTFDYALFTNLTEDHLDYHGSMEDYFGAKRALFEQTRHAVVNTDDAFGKKLFSLLSCPKTDCGVLERASHFIEDLYEKEWESTKYTCVAPYISFEVSYPLFGAFNVYNTLLAATTALLCGICPEQIRGALQALSPIEGRFERLPLDTPFSVVIDYAHTPDAMEQALKAARKRTAGRLIAVFGAGGDREKEKRSAMGRVAEENADFCIITSDNTRSESPRAILADILSGMRQKEKRQVISDRKHAIITALSLLRSGDTLLLLGKGHESYLITQDGRQAFSEREIVYSYVTEQKQNL